MALNLNLENKKQVATILLAIGLGLVAAYLMGAHIENSIKQQTRLIAQEAEKKNAAMINEINALNQRLQAQQQATAQQIAELRSRQVEIPQQPGSQQSAGSKLSLAVKTPPGKRAVTILIDSLSAVGGMVGPGDYVDILAQLNIPDPKTPTVVPQKVTSVIFQNILVLAVGTNLTTVSGEIYDMQQRAGALNVTLAMEPEEASLLNFALQNGRLQLTLRSPNEKETQILQVASWDALSDYLLQKQGTELLVPKSKADIESVEDKSGKKDEVKPFIQIFKGGREL